MSRYIVLAAMKGEFLALSGNVYENFQMLGYVNTEDHFDAVKHFFEEPQFPIDWGDVRYMWAESLQENVINGHYGDYHLVFIEDLTRAVKDI